MRRKWKWTWYVKLRKNAGKKNNSIDGEIDIGRGERSITIGMVWERMLGK